jgi:DNA repair protein NreA
MNTQCLKCKGNGHCGRSYCPHILRSKAMFKVEKNIDKSDFSTSSPAPFVGRFGYPNINVGILSTPNLEEDAWLYDAPKHWAKENFKIPKIIDLRSSLVNSRFKVNIKKQNKFLDISQEISMASRPVDIEVSLEDKPKFRLNNDTIMAPLGPNADLKKADITSNPKIHTKVDKVVSDTDLKANDAVNYLYKNNFDENFLTKILSVGNLGLKNNRKLVPSRWSITAVDDLLGKHLYQEILDYSQISDYMVYFENYLGNYYLIIMIPDVWSYELFETYMPNASWNTSKEVSFTTDFETCNGRKNYAQNCTGGYYSVRLGVLEKFKQMKRQGSCIAIRIITGEYTTPLGVWVTREAARITLKEKPLKFGSLNLLLKYVNALIKKKFGFDSNIIITKSLLIKNFKSQSKLSKFF